MMYPICALLTYSLASRTLLSHALPLVPEQPAIRRRLAYSVVAVDGGSAATLSPSNTPAATTVIHTVDLTETVTAPAVTLPASTETVLSTAVVRESEPAKTVKTSVTLDITRTVLDSPPAATASQMPSYLVVNAGGTPSSAMTVLLTTQASTASTTIVCTSPIAIATPTSTSIAISTSHPTFTSTSSSASVSATSYLASASTSTLVNLSTLTTSPNVYSAPTFPSTAVLGVGTLPVGSPLPVGLAPPSTTGFTAAIAQPTTTSRTYDNGMWHTRYPSWNATSTTVGSSATAVIARGAHNIWNK